MPKTHELTGKIISKEPRKVYKKNGFYGQINYKLKVLREEKNPQEYETILVYSNLVSKQILKILEQNQYIDKRYFFTYQKTTNGLVLQEWKELENHD